MNEVKFGVNIDVNEVVRNYDNTRSEAVEPKKKTVFDPKNYLSARLGQGETEKTMTIRLLPFSVEDTDPFKKVYIHTVKVNKELSQSGWKTFICPTHNKMGDECPFCEVSKKSKELRFSAGTEIEKKKFGEIEYMNKAKVAYIVRCIERGHEEDGPKFWMFNENRQGKGVYDQLIKIQKRRQEKAALKGETCNIFDLNDGKDLILSITKDINNKTVITVVDDDERTPLTTDYELGMSWINNSKKWTDVYTVKPYDYMAIVVQNGVPMYDKTQNKYVDKAEKVESDNAAEKEEFNENYTEQKTDYSEFKETPLMASSGKIDDIDIDLPF